MTCSESSLIVVLHVLMSPVGAVVTEVGSLSRENDWKFSSKYFDAETELGYWGFRYYSSDIAHWMSKDPLGEWGGVQMYVFAANRPTSLWDAYGGAAAGADDDPHLHDPAIIDVPPNIPPVKIDCVKSKPKPGEPTMPCTSKDIKPIADATALAACNSELKSTKGKPEVRDFWSPFSQKCPEPPVECRTCCGPCKSISGAYVPDQGTVAVCWPKSQNTMASTLIHETSHYLQSCSKTFPRGCAGSLKQEIQAYYCSGSCKTFSDCVAMAAKSSCLVGSCKDAAAITPAMMQELLAWSYDKIARGALCNEFSN